MRKANHDTYIGTAFLLFCAVAWWLVSDLPTGAGYSKMIGPEFFPGLMAAVIAILSFVLVVRSLWRGAAISGEDFGVATGKVLLRIVLFVALLVVYVLLYEPLGFLLSSLLVLPVGMVMLDERRWMQVVFFPAFIVVLFYFIFTKVIMVPLPEFPLYLYVS